MKAKHFMAAALCCVTLLAGCGEGSEDEGRSSSSYSDSSSTTSSSSTVVFDAESSEQSASTMETEQSTPSYSSEPEEVKNKIPTPYIYRIYDELDDGKLFQLQWDVDDSNFMVDESYDMTVFWSSTPNGQEKSKDVDAWRPIRISGDDLFSGDNYFRIQLYNSKGVSEISEPYCFSLMVESKTSDVHQYMHTFEAPEGFVIVPDYSEAINDINNGVQPTQFYAEMTFICPSCGGKNYMPGKYFSYTEDSSAYCRMQCSRDTRCPYNKYSYVYINSYAVQIS